MKVTIIGCGSIGASWAALFAALGRHNVHAWDPSPEVRAAFAEKVEHSRQQLMELGAERGADVTVHDRAEEALWGTEWVQENAPERLDLKAQIFAHIESVVTRDCVLASSTSSFTWSQLAAEMKHPERFLTAHSFNPPHLIPLVELFSPHREILDRATSFYSEIGRVPVCMKKEAAGHIGNRLASALWREAVHIVAEGIADVAEVDRALIHGVGMRWAVVGTHLSYHLSGGEGGIDHYLQDLGASQERRWSTLGSPKLTPEVCQKIVSGVHAEAGEREVAELREQRDRQLMEMLRLRQTHPTIDQK